MSISYTRINWQDTAGGETPLSAENLNHMEQGIVDCANAIPSLPLSQQDGGTGVNGMSVAANKVFASPVSGSGEASFRALNQADIPELNASKITLGTLPIERGGTGAGTEQAARTALGVPSSDELQAVQDSIKYIADDVAANIATARENFEVTGARYRQFGKIAFCTIAVKTTAAINANTTYAAATFVAGRRPEIGVGCEQTNSYNNVPGGISAAGVLNIRPTINVGVGVTMYYSATFVVA